MLNYLRSGKKDTSKQKQVELSKYLSDKRYALTIIIFVAAHERFNHWNHLMVPIDLRQIYVITSLRVILENTLVEFWACKER